MDLEKIDRNLEKMQAQGASKEEMQQYFDLETQQAKVSEEPEQETQSSWRGGYLKARPYLETTLEGVGLGGGAIVGSGGGPAGTVAGGALGYAGAREAIDLADKAFGVTEEKALSQEAMQTIKDMRTGAMLTAGGEIAGVALRGVAGPIIRQAKKVITPLKKVAAPLRGKAVKKMAGKEIASQGTELTSKQISRNIKVAKNLERKIAGLKFTRGQVTNDAQAISLERALIRSGTRITKGKFEISGADLNQEQKAFAEKVLQDYYKRKLLSKGIPGKFTDVLVAEKQGLKAGVKTAEDKINLEVARLGRAIDEQEAGAEMIKRVGTAKRVAKKEAARLYDKIPNAKMGTDDLYEGVRGLIRAEDKILEPRTKDMIRLTLKHIRKGKESIDVSYRELRKIRSRIGKNIRVASSGANPNYEDARQLKALQGEVENTMAQIEHISPEAGKAYRAATKFYREKFIPQFRQGVVADILQKGSRGEESKIALSNVASKFFTKDGIDDFLRAVESGAGKQNVKILERNRKVAMDAMRDYARFDFLNRPGVYDLSTGTIKSKSAMVWIHRNAKVLDKLGMTDEMSSVANKAQGLEFAQAKLDVFNKSMAAKVLNAGPEKMVEQAFSTSKNYAATAKELLSLAKGNEAAEQGIKKAISEHIFDSSKVTAEGFFTNYKISLAKLTKQLVKFKPALRVIYRKEPEKLKALWNVQKAYKIAGRNIASPIGGGSDTMENFSHIMAAATGARAGQYYLLISIKKAITKYSDSQINKYLLRATFDPDYAANLIALSRAKETTVPVLVSRFDNLMAKLILLGGEKISRKNDRGKP